METGSHCVALASPFLQPFLLSSTLLVSARSFFFFKGGICCFVLILFFSAFVLSAFKVVCVALATLELCQSTLVPNSESKARELYVESSRTARAT